MLNGDQTDVTDVTMATSNKVCLYNKLGYCKRKSDCKFKHIDSICEQIRCNIEKCDQRHPKQCRHNMKCRRRLTCHYKHELKLSDQIINLKEEMLKNNENNKEREEKIKQQDKYIIELKEEIKNIKEAIKNKDKQIKNLVIDISNSKKILKQNQ